MATLKPAVLVTGAAGGVGSAVVERFARSGWTTFGADVREQPEHSVADGWCAADLRRVDECRRAVAEAAAVAGRLDCVVNAAGVWTEGPSEATTEEEWDRVVDLNLKAVYFVSTAAIPHLTRQRWLHLQPLFRRRHPGQRRCGRVLRVEGRRVEPHARLALELAPSASASTRSAPAMSTHRCSLTRRRPSASADPGGYLATSGPGTRRATRHGSSPPAEVAELIWFLAQPTATAITGANISIDFGLSAGIT